MFWNNVLRNEESIIPEPTPMNERSDAHEHLICGRQRLVAHSTPDFTPESATLCHTIAHAPYPATASHIPTTAPTARPATFETATIDTSIRFINRLVCTMAEAFNMKVKNITRDSGTRRISPWKQRAINGAQNHSATYMPTATAMLNHSTEL